MPNRIYEAWESSLGKNISIRKIKARKVQGISESSEFAKREIFELLDHTHSYSIPKEVFNILKRLTKN